jgi:hypothetical protein
MTAADSAGDPPSRRENTDRSLRLPARARPRAARRRFAATTRGRFEWPAAQNFLRQLRALDVGNSIVLFGSSMLLSVLPFIILLSSLANHRIDTDLSLHIRRREPNGKPCG